jgi:hypothetical protein
MAENDFFALPEIDFKKKEPEEKVFDFYLSEQEQREAEAESSTNVADILDTIDNINRPYYAVSAGVDEMVRGIKKDKSRE